MNVTICRHSPADAWKSRQSHPHQHRHRRHLRPRGKEGRHRRRRTLIDVGRPHVERHRRYLEGKTRQHEDQAEHHAERRRTLQRRGDAREGDRAGIAVHQRYAVEQHARGERAEHKIFDAGLGGAQVVAAIGGDDIERQTHQFEAEVQRDEIGGRYQHHHAERPEQQQHGKFEAADLVAAHEVDRQQQRRQRADQRERLHEARERIVGEGAIERDALRPVSDQKDDERDAEQRDGALGHQPDRALPAQRPEEDEHEHAERQDEFGQDDRERKRRRVHG